MTTKSASVAPPKATVASITADYETLKLAHSALADQLERSQELAEDRQRTVSILRQSYTQQSEELERTRKERDAMKGDALEAARLRGKLEVYEAMYPNAQADAYQRMRPDADWREDHRYATPRRPGDLR